MEEVPSVTDGLPDLGVLTQTVVSSPLVIKILLARLRDTTTDDIIFIGNDFVQVKELLNDGHLYDVVRKEGFGSRIRNAQVIGSVEDYEQDVGQIQRDDLTDDPANRPWKTVKSRLPPQTLVLQLCTGDIVFLGIQLDKSRSLKLVSLQRRRIEKPTHKLQAGMHFAVDPTSRYIALGCSEGIFAIHALYPRKKMQEQLLTDSPIQFIESGFHLFSDGAILNMEFLFPGADDNNQITLLVTKALMGQTRMLFFRWEAGCDVSKIRPHNPNGILLQDQRKLPLLVIPLTVNSSFILVFETTLSVYQGMLEGNPSIANYEMSISPPLAYFIGKNTPLWTAWTRAQRVPPPEARDYIFLIREDGLLVYLEIDIEIEGLVSSDYKVAMFEESCGTAFACINFYGSNLDLVGDVVFTGGDSCTGGAYLLQAREEARILDHIQNWSPAHDFTIANLHYGGSACASKFLENHKLKFPRPDRIFACVGRGKNGAVTEFRHGLEAKIALMSEYDVPIIQSWVFHESVTDEDEQGSEALFLLSLDDSSAVLRLDTDCTTMTELDNDSTKFDLRFRTIAASEKNNLIVQVTEKSIMMSTPSSVHIYIADDLFQIQHSGGQMESGTKIYQAAIGNGFVVFTTSIKDTIYLQILVSDDFKDCLVIDSPAFLTNARIGTIERISSHVTCLTLSLINGITFLIVSEWDGEKSVLKFFSLDKRSTQIPSLPVDVALGAQIISISVLTVDSGNLLFYCGTRDGLLVTLEIQNISLAIVASRCDRIGSTSVIITKDEYSLCGHFVICDSCLYALIPKRFHKSQSKNYTESFEITRVWFTDISEPGLKQPEIRSIASRPPFQVIGKNRDCLLTSGSRVILASLEPESKTVPRQIVFGGSPSRIIYSDSFKALVVATSLNGRSTILFIDPETGDNLSQPLDQKTKKPAEFISGLGHLNERIFRLFEWKYTKDGRKWSFIIVSTSLGRVLIISVDSLSQIQRDVQNMAFQPAEEKEFFRKKRSRISYYTRYKFWAQEPVYSVVGYPDGLLWCAGNTLFCDALDLTDKKFKRVAEHELSSPAADLGYRDGNIYALTLSHSLEILKLFTNDFGVTVIIKTHGDPITRPALSHSIYISKNPDTVHLVSDKMSKLVGLRPTHNKIMETLEIVFEARLPESIIKIRHGKCRPQWDPFRNPDRITKRNFQADERNRRLERKLMEMNKTEIMGLSITGSLIHFTILDLASWKFLRFLSILAMRSPKVCEFTYRDNVDLDPLKIDRLPKVSMHIDGDLLKRCLKDRLIEDILELNTDKENPHLNYSNVISYKTTKLSIKLYELLQDLHHGSLSINDGIDVCIEQVYLDLEFFLRPVI